MAIPVWQPGTLYNPGATVRPATVAPVVSTPIPNGNFESGNQDWTTGANWTIEQKGSDQHAAFDGTWAAKYSGSGASEARIVSQTNFPVRPGQALKAKCYVRQGDSNAGNAGGRIELDWLDENEALIFSSQGTLIDAEPKNAWKPSEVDTVAPAGAAFVRPAGYAFRAQGNSPLWIDTFTWDYSYQANNTNLFFLAVQPDAGFSDGVEPAWPSVVGQTVIDNEVVWEALDQSRVVWEANPIFVSGDTEPSWPNSVGENVVDNTIVWEAISRRVEDEKCPNTKYVAIASSKIFCGDDDIIGFSATVNPLDWSTLEDAGYLPFGLQNYGANPVRNLALYRANLVGFNAQGAQIWQVDEDPANMALLDAVPIASIYYKTGMPVMNDLIFLNPVGVRNLGVAGASTNLQANGVGEPIDALVLAEIRAGLHVPHAIFVPAYGQYWLFFGAQVFVLTITGATKKRWSRYTFPEAITDATLLGQDLYLRTEDHKVWKVDPEVLVDDEVDPTEMILTPGAGSSGGATVTGYESRTEADSGITGAPFGGLVPNDIADTVEVVYFEWSTDEGSGDTTVQFALTQNGFQPPSPAFETISFVDDDNVTWTFERADSLEPDGQNGTYDGGDLTYWLWTLTDAAGPNVTLDDDYVITITPGSAIEPAGDVPITGVMWWPFLDLGQLGTDKELVGFDLVADAPEGVTVSIGYNQKDRTQRTPDYTMEADTLTGQMVPMPVVGPTFDLKITFAPGQAWEWQAAVLYVQDDPVGTS